MSQGTDRACPRCGTLVASDQRFCSNCGSIVEMSANHPTEQTPSGGVPMMGNYKENYTETPPPPPPESYAQAPLAPPSQIYQPPSYAAVPQKDASKKVLGQIGCGVLAIILLGVGVCGAAGFFVYSTMSVSTKNVKQSIQNVNGSGNTSSDGATPTFAPPTTSPVNASIKFADVDVAIKDVKVASGFADDTHSYSNSPVVRIDFSENNKTARSSSYYYDDVMRLLLADGTSLLPSSTRYFVGPDAAVSRTNWVDFAVSSAVDTKKLTLQLGKADEAQISVPLTNNPDVAKYQPKTVTLNKTTQYVGTDWTLTSATVQLSSNNQQAPKGQMYAIVSVRIDNNSSKSFQGIASDYLRLQTGDTKAVSTDCTIPLGADAGQTNQTGTCAFLVPQGSTSFTLLLIANASTGATQPSSIPFQIQ